MRMCARNKFAAVLKMLKFTEILKKLACFDIFCKQITKTGCIGKLAAVKRQKLGITCCMPPAPDFFTYLAFLQGYAGLQGIKHG